MDVEELLDAAMEIIGTSPMPDDAFQQITKLESQAPKDYRWGWIWEGFVTAGGIEPDD